MKARRLTIPLLSTLLLGIPAASQALQVTSYPSLRQGTVPGPGAALLAGEASETLSDRSNRLTWTLVGAGIGAGVGFLVAGPADPFGDKDNKVEFAVGGAILGGLAGFILSGPSPGEGSELVTGSRLFVPPRGGVGINLTVP